MSFVFFLVFVNFSQTLNTIQMHSFAVVVADVVVAFECYFFSCAVFGLSQARRVVVVAWCVCACVMRSTGLVYNADDSDADDDDVDVDDSIGLFRI